MAFGNISAFYFPIAANAGASMHGTDVRKLLASADAALDATTKTDHGTSGSVSQKYVDPYTTRSAAGAIAAGWQVEPLTDMASVIGARRFIPAGNHVCTARLATTAALGGTLSAVVMSVWKVGPSPSFTLTLVGGVTVSNFAVPAAAYATCTLTAACPEMIFEPGETVLYTFAISGAGLIISGIVNTFATGTQGGVAISVNHPGLKVLADGAFTAAGVGTPVAVGNNRFSAVASATAAASTAGVGASRFSGVFTAAGIAATAAIGAARASTVFSAAGLSTTDGKATGIFSGVFDAAGVGSSSWKQTNIFSGVFSAAGLSTPEVVGSSVGSGVFSAIGLATTDFKISSVAGAVFNAAGAATSSWKQTNIFSGVFDAAGVASTDGKVTAIFSGVFSGSGQATTDAKVTALFSGVFAATGQADGDFKASSVSGGIFTGTGVASADFKTSKVLSGTFTADVGGGGGTITIIRPIIMIGD